MKDVAKFVPGIGWMFLFMEYPILKRKWEDDERKLAESCKTLSDYPVNMLVSTTCTIVHVYHVITVNLKNFKNLKNLEKIFKTYKKVFIHV